MWFYYALSASILWGLNYTLNAKLLKSVSAMSLMIYQMILGSLIFIIIGNKEKIVNDLRVVFTNRDLLFLVFTTILISLAASMCIYKSIASKNAVLAALIETSYPLFTLFFSWLIFKDNFFNIQTIIGSVLIFIGIYIISRA
jgi:drug/metabolite transporter (DMT)-like permease